MAKKFETKLKKKQRLSPPRTNDSKSRLPLEFYVILALLISFLCLFQWTRNSIKTESEENSATRDEGPSSLSGSEKVKGSALGALLDSYLTTSIQTRELLSPRVVNDLISNEESSWNPNALLFPGRSEGTMRTSGGLSPLGYAILLHDVPLVEYFLSLDSGDEDSSSSSSRSSSIPPTTATPCDPTALVAAAPPSPSAPRERDDRGGRLLLGAFHESALNDQLRPLHLALLHKVSSFCIILGAVVFIVVSIVPRLFYLYFSSFSNLSPTGRGC